MREKRIRTTLDPPVLRTLLSAAAVLVLLVPAVSVGADAPPMAPADRLEAAVLDELNLVRLEHGLHPLRLSPQLTEAADAHSRAMVVSGTFRHESPDGTHFAARIKGFYKPRAAMKKWMVGENLIWKVRRLSARAAVTSWLTSPGHRENLLSHAFRDVGISAVRAHGAPGVFGQRRVVVLTVDFGAR